LGYIEKNLMEGERLLAKASLHWIVFFVPILVALFFVMVGINGSCTSLTEIF